MIFDPACVDVNRGFMKCLFSPVDSDAHSTTSSVSPAQSPSYSNQSDDGSDIESKQRRSTPSIFSFLDRSYWKRYPSSQATAVISRGSITWFWKGLLKDLSFSVQAEGVLRDSLQGSLWWGDHWPSTLQALLQFQKTNAGIHTSGHRPSWRTSPAAPGRREGKLVTAFITPPCRVIQGIRLCLQWQTSMFLFLRWNLLDSFFFLLIVSFYMGIFLHFCIESIFSFIKKRKKNYKKMLRALVLFIGRGQNVRHHFWFWIILIILY